MRLCSHKIRQAAVIIVVSFVNGFDWMVCISSVGAKSQMIPWAATVMGCFNVAQTDGLERSDRSGTRSGADTASKPITELETPFT